jgi:transcriptional regulator with XRE-family HTH domain
MKSFGSLLRQLRGSTPLTEMAARLGISKGYLANLEAGRKIPPEARARALLQQGFGLPAPAVTRLLLEVQLGDAGLHDPELRQLVIALIQQTLPASVQQELRQLYRRSASDSKPPPHPSR